MGRFSKTVVGRIEQLYCVGLLLIFGLIVLHAPLSVYIGSLVPTLALEVKAWKEILMVILAVLAVIILTHRQLWRRFLSDWVVIVAFLLIIIHLVSVQYIGHGVLAYVAGLMIDLRYVAYFLLIYVAMMSHPELRRTMLKVGAAGALVVLVFALFEWAVLPKDFLSLIGYSKSTISPYTTIDSYQGLVRLQSTLRGPNPLGAYTMILALIGIAYLLKRKVSISLRYVILSLVAVSLAILYASYSRSAYIGLVGGAVILGALYAGVRRLRDRRVISGVIAAIIVVAALAYVIRDTTFFQSVFVHEVAGSGPLVNSDQGHAQSLQSGVTSFILNPFGFGVGSTGSASLLSNNGYIIENQYLFVAHEVGALGVALFLVFYAGILMRAYKRRDDALALGVLASGIGLAIVGLFLPVFVDDTVALIWFGLAALVGLDSKDNHGKRPAHRKAA